MGRIALVTDSTSDIRKMLHRTRDHHHPLTVHFGDESYSTGSRSTARSSSASCVRLPSCQRRASRRPLTSSGCMSRC